MTAGLQQSTFDTCLHNNAVSILPQGRAGSFKSVMYAGVNAVRLCALETSVKRPVIDRIHDQVPGAESMSLGEG